MFIGHFGVALAAKKVAPKVNLAILFIFCQLLDLIWPVLVLANIEQVSVDHTATAVTPLNFSHYPYSHSLVSTILYSLVAAFIAWRIFSSTKIAIVSFGVVLSHWILDFITHRPDLPIFLGDEKFGLGLWNSVWSTFFVEVAIFILGIILFIKTTYLLSLKRKIIFWSMITFLSIIYIANIFGPKVPLNTPPAAIAGPALAMWLIVLWAYFADRNIKQHNQ